MRNKDRPEGATVISASPEDFRDPLFRFAADLCQTDRVDLIIHPHMDAVLVNADTRHLSPQERFLLREITTARAAASARNGSCACVIVPRVAYCPDDPHFEACVHLARKEQEIVTGWGFFRGNVHVGYLIPTGEFVCIGD